MANPGVRPPQGTGMLGFHAIQAGNRAGQREAFTAECASASREGRRWNAVLPKKPGELMVPGATPRGPGSKGVFRGPFGLTCGQAGEPLAPQR